MAVPHHDQIPGAQILRQILFLMGHTDPQTLQRKVEHRRKLLRPLLIRVSPDDMDRRDLPQPLQDLRPAGIARVEDRVRAIQRGQQLRPEQIVGV